MARAFIGTSGFNYAHWKGVLYPEGMPTKVWLEHFVQHYNSVELNVTFYRLPPAATFASWARRSPEGFAFVLKGSRYVTHVKRLREPQASVELFFRAARPLGRKLACVLWQLPPTMRADVPRLRTFLAALRSVDASSAVRQAFEFRHLSWYAPEVYRALEDFGAGLSFPDWPLQVLPPGMRTRGLFEPVRPVVRAPLTSDFVYLRRHGPGERYRSGYPRSMLDSDARWCRTWLADGRDVLAFYNNDWGGHAVRDAAALARRVGAPPVRVAEQPAPWQTALARS